METTHELTVRLVKALIEKTRSGAVKWRAHKTIAHASIGDIDLTCGRDLYGLIMISDGSECSAWSPTTDEEVWAFNELFSLAMGRSGATRRSLVENALSALESME